MITVTFVFKEVNCLLETSFDVKVDDSTLFELGVTKIVQQLVTKILNEACENASIIIEIGKKVKEYNDDKRRAESDGNKES